MNDNKIEDFYKQVIEYMKDKFKKECELSLAVPSNEVYMFKLYKDSNNNITFKQKNKEVSEFEVLLLLEHIYFNFNRCIFTLGAYTDQVHYRLNQKFIEYWCFLALFKNDEEIELIEMDADHLKKAHNNLILDGKSDIDIDLVIYRDKNNIIMGMEVD